MNKLLKLMLHSENQLTIFFFFLSAADRVYCVHTNWVPVYNISVRTKKLQSKHNIFRRLFIYLLCVVFMQRCAYIVGYIWHGINANLLQHCNLFCPHTSLDSSFSVLQKRNAERKWIHIILCLLKMYGMSVI